MLRAGGRRKAAAGGEEGGVLSSGTRRSGATRSRRLLGVGSFTGELGKHGARGSEGTGL